MKITKIKNASGVDDTWVGQTIKNGLYYELQKHEHKLWSDDSIVLAAIDSGDLVVNNGTSDLSVADGRKYLGAPKDMVVASAPPSTTDDKDSDVVIGQAWLNDVDNKTYVCLDNAVGGALWKESTKDDLVYGEMHKWTPAGSNTDVILSDTYYKITGLSSGNVSRMQFADDTLVIDADEDGYYYIGFSSSYSISGTGTTTIAIHINGVPTQSLLARTSDSTNTGMCVSDSAIIYLIAGDIICVRAKLSVSGKTFTNYYTDLSVHKIMAGAIGPIGPPGPPGDFVWEGEWTNQNYVANSAVSYNGGSYICNTNTTTQQVPTDTNYWDVIASQGDPAPSEIIVKDEGTNVANTPHQELNFIGTGVTVTDGGAGIANVTITGDVTSVAGKTGVVTLNTSDVSESGNLYYTEGRVSANTSVASNTTHAGITNNPHTVTKTQVGLGNVDDIQQLPLSQKGAVNGVATLDGGGKVPSSQLNLSNVVYKGTWNATTNSPSLTNSGTGGGAGDYYVISVAGSTSVDGITDWAIGDWIIHNGTTWDKNDNTDQVTSVAGKQGAVTLDTADVSEGSSLYYTEGRVSANTDVAANTAAKHTHANTGVLDATTASFLAADEIKLDGIATGATVNDTDANLKARANHTGTQLAATISDFDSTVTSSTHAGLTTNPHTVTKAQVGLGSADNTSDANKPVSTATQSALDTKANATQLDGYSAIGHAHTTANITNFDTEVGNHTDVAANTAAKHTHANAGVLDATTASFLSADETKLGGISAGATANDTDANLKARANHTGTQAASTISDFDATVTSSTHAGLTNNPHTVTKAQVGLGSTDNTSDANKPVSTATQTALDNKADATQLDGYSAVGHAHTASDVTDFDTEVGNHADVAANTAAKHTHANAGVLDATTASFLAADETKLDGIATGATANDTDANLKARVNHTGTQTASTISDFDATVTSSTHAGLTSNPHTVTKAQVGLGNADNTSDANKPVSTAAQTALDLKVNNSEKGSANGVATLDGGGKVPASQLNLSNVVYKGTWNSSTNTPTLSDSGVGGATGDYYVVSVAGSTSVDGITSWGVGDWIIHNGTTWDKNDNTDQVTSVAGKQGAVTLDTNDVSEAGNLYYTEGRVSANTDVAANTTHASDATKHRIVNDAGTSATELWSANKIDASLNVKADKTLLDGYALSSHAHTASDVTDFDTEVGNHADVTANTAAKHTHANAGVLDATTASFLAADETKLDGIATGATANDTDANLKARANHTGTQTASTISDFDSTVTSSTHAGLVNNPHTVTKAQVGLGSADNTSDANKPVSTATQTALDLKVDDSEKGAANGVATLDGGGKVPSSQLNLSNVVYKGTWSAATNTPALSNSGGGGGQGDYYVVSASGATSVDGITDWQSGDWVINNGVVWQKNDNTDQVTSVAGKQGAVTLYTSDVQESSNLYYTEGRVSANTSVSANTAAKHTHANTVVLDATTASFLTADETKLDGIAAGATVNDTDANLKARANHTGTQTASTISDFDATVTSSTHAGLANNPHSVSAAQVGSATAQWNADKIKDVAVDDTNKTDGYALVYKVSSGNIEYSTVAAVSVSGLNDLTDVDTATTPPNNNEVLKWNGANWTPGVGTAVGVIDDLTDVDTVTAAPTVGDTLRWNGTNWVPQSSNAYMFAGTMTSWTPSGDLYYADAAHNLGSNDISIETYLTSDNKSVGVEELERIDGDTLRVWVAVPEDLRVVIMSRPYGRNFAYTIASWTPAGNDYYSDVVHGFGTNDIMVNAFISATGKDVGVEEIERLDTNTIRITSASNDENVRVLLFAADS